MPVPNMVFFQIKTSVLLDNTTRFFLQKSSAYKRNCLLHMVNAFVFHYIQQLWLLAYKDYSKFCTRKCKKQHYVNCNYNGKSMIYINSNMALNNNLQQGWPWTIEQDWRTIHLLKKCFGYIIAIRNGKTSFRFLWLRLYSYKKLS